MSLIFSTHCFAGKIKSSESLIPQLQTEQRQVLEVLDDLKEYVDGIKEVGSFVKNDFWKTHPSFYLEDRSARRVTSKYFFSRSLQKSKNPVRKINNIFLVADDAPYGIHEEWSVYMEVPYGELLINGGKFTDKDDLEDYLTEHKVQRKQFDAILDDYSGDLLKNVTLIFSDIIQRIDLFYGGMNAARIINKSSLIKFFGSYETLMDASKHPEVLENEGKKFVISALHDILEESDGIHNEVDFVEQVIHNKYSKSELSIAMSRQYFVVGQGMGKASQESQIIDFDLLLKKKVEQGKAIQSEQTIDRVKFLTYSDVSGSTTYPATVFFNKETGAGIWQIGYWDSKSDLEKIEKRLKIVNDQLYKTFTKYLEMRLQESIHKMNPKIKSENFTDEF